MIERLRCKVYAVPQWARVTLSFPTALLFGCTLNLAVRGRWGLA